jgi:hypothetical protein
MKSLFNLFLIATALLFTNVAFAQQKAHLGDNAALRYWAALSEMQDSGITPEQAKELSLILKGTARYRDLSYRELMEKNIPALTVMARGTAIPHCDWGLDYDLGSQTPVEYARKSLELGRLNVLYAFHLSLVGDKEATALTLVAGIHFSHDVAAGGSLFATVVAKDLLVNHFKAIEGLLHLQALTVAQHPELKKSIAQLGPVGLDWQMAMKYEFEALNRPEWQKSLQNIRQSYMAALNDKSALPDLQAKIAKAPADLQKVIPNPQRVLDEQQDFSKQLQRIRQVLQ